MCCIRESYTIFERVAARLYFRPKFMWFSLDLGHASCLVRARLLFERIWSWFSFVISWLSFNLFPHLTGFWLILVLRILGFLFKVPYFANYCISLFLRISRSGYMLPIPWFSILSRISRFGWVLFCFVYRNSGLPFLFLDPPTGDLFLLAPHTTPQFTSHPTTPYHSNNHVLPPLTKDLPPDVTPALHPCTQDTHLPKPVWVNAFQLQLRRRWTV